MILNVVCAALAITGVVLYSLDLRWTDHTGYYYDSCAERYNSYSGYSDYNSYDRYQMPSHEERRKTEACLYYKNLVEVMIL